MSLIFGPKYVTRKIGHDDERFVESFQNAFKGKDDENFVAKTKLITKYTVLASATMSMFDITLWSSQYGIVSIVTINFHFIILSQLVL